MPLGQAPDIKVFLAALERELPENSGINVSIDDPTDVHKVSYLDDQGRIYTINVSKNQDGSYDMVHLINGGIVSNKGKHAQASTHISHLIAVHLHQVFGEDTPVGQAIYRAHAEQQQKDEQRHSAQPIEERHAHI